ncbi:MAG: SRPBCC family protein [Deltaproteobacteria bacterium]|nr:SRPBCC family protein [Deltaproteobacteria bacterium]
MGTVTGKINLHAPMERVWKFITDPENFPKYVYGYSGGEVLTSDKTGVGARYRWYGKIGILKLKSVEEIVEWEDNRRVAYSGTLFGIRFASSMTIVLLKNDTTLLTVSIKYTIPVFMGGVITDFLMAKRIVKDYVDKSIEKLEQEFNSESYRR